MNYETVLYAVSDSICTISLNRPEKLNAWTRQMHFELRDAMHRAGADPAVRVIILTGAGRGFCAGADLSDPDRQNSAMSDSGSALEKFFNPTIKAMRSLPKPIVSAVNGVAAGVGIRS